MSEKDEELSNEINRLLESKGFSKGKFDYNEGKQSNFSTSRAGENNFEYPEPSKSFLILTITAEKNC